MKLNCSRTVQIVGLCVLVVCGECRCLRAGQRRGGGSHSPAASPSDASRSLEAQMAKLQSAIGGLEAQMSEVEKEAAELRSELRDTRTQLAALQAAGRPAPMPAAARANPAAPEQPHASAGREQIAKSVVDRLSNLEENQQLLQTKISDQYQEKVESASKHRVILSGIALLNVFSNRGTVDNIDVPQVAQERGPLDSNAVFGATVRQSSIGLDVFGPTLAGARTYGEVRADFFGGFPDAPDGATAGIMRIRTAAIHMDWSDTSIVAGQDNLFFSPLSPTSFASLAEPAFAYSGDLWAWVPQIRVEHRIKLSENSALTLQGGILDSLTGEPPVYGYYRSTQAGEASGQPGYAGRFAWSGSLFGRPVTAGVGGYYSPENWGFGRDIDGWAATADWDVPIGRWFSVSGELYRGDAVGGLGGGIGRSTLYNGVLSSPATSVLGLNSVGGWQQLKFRPIERLEFNGAFGLDQAFAADIRRFQPAESYANPSLLRNQSGLVNIIYYPRADLLLSLEYRRIWTSEIDKAPYRAGQISLGAGVLF